MKIFLTNYNNQKPASSCQYGIGVLMLPGLLMFLKILFHAKTQRWKQNYIYNL